MGKTIARFRGRIIEGITLDFWNTIAADGGPTGHLSRREERAHAAHEWLSQFGKEVDLEEVKRAFNDYAALWMRQWQQHNRTPGPIDAAAYLIVWLGLHLNRSRARELGEILEDVMLDHPPEPVEGAIDAVKALAKHLPLALVSDTGISGPRVLDKLLERWGLLELIPHRVYSLDQGVSKPHPVMFRTALGKLSVPTHRALHIGDLDATDVLGAKNLGMACIRFDGIKPPENCSKCGMMDIAVRSWNEILEQVEIIEINEPAEKE